MEKTPGNNKRPASAEDTEDSSRPTKKARTTAPSSETADTEQPRDFFRRQALFFRSKAKELRAKVKEMQAEAQDYLVKADAADALNALMQKPMDDLQSVDPDVASFASFLNPVHGEYEQPRGWFVLDPDIVKAEEEEREKIKAVAMEKEELRKNLYSTEDDGHEVPSMTNMATTETEIILGNIWLEGTNTDTWKCAVCSTPNGNDVSACVACTAART